jgi:hypothetical protein
MFTKGDPVMSIKSFAGACALSALGVAAHAGDAGVLYGQMSTLGLGIGYALPVAEHWAVRAQYNNYQRAFTGDLADTGSTGNLNIQLALETFELLGDWYPFSGGFRLTAGAAANNNRITFSGVGTVNGQSANVNGTLQFGSGVSPYLGLGYSSRAATARGWGVNVDAGILFQNPSATLTASGNPSVTQSDVNTQQAKINSDAQSLRNYPVIGVGLTYAF